MTNFEKHKMYRRQQIWEAVVGKDQRMTRNFQQSGYERLDDELFAFINIGYKGNAGQIFPNQYDRASETVRWYGKKKTHSNQPLMRGIIDGSVIVHCFARWNPKPQFEYLGVGMVINYRDGFDQVFESDGTQTHCIEFELSCRSDLESRAFINNFDQVYEEMVSEEGKEKYVRHKTRERNSEIIQAKKDDFYARNGRLFCEACGFDFQQTYGERGDGFIECHHNVPLHEADSVRQTRISDLTLLCSNCHRMVHRRRQWLTVDELKTLLSPVSLPKAN